MTEQAKIAVIGLGPRGLGALEALAAAGSAGGLALDVFEPGPYPGAGPNFSPDESALCLLNIPMRDLSIRPPAFTRCGGFGEWLKEAPGPDAFPTRADLGRYLEARYADLRGLGQLDIRHFDTRVTALRRGSEGWWLEAGRWHGPYAEVLLTLGQPEVAPDDQWAGWEDHAAEGAAVVAQAYPAARLIEAARDWSGKTVAIRGLGLSCFDVLRALTVGQGGRFEGGRYLASGREAARILPFSLDGQPPFPKPASGALDARFRPGSRETAEFSEAMEQATAAQPDAARDAISEALAHPVSRVLRENGAADAAAEVANWIAAEWREPGVQDQAGPIETLRQGLALAEGKMPPTVGYVAGQVWRHWQDAVRAGFNPVQATAETAEAIVSFDEGMKRYSYGPPVDSACEMLMLAEAGLLTMDFTRDPEISEDAAGWRLACEDAEAEVSVMVDAVLPNPDLGIVTDGLIKGLQKDGRLCQVAEGFGARITADGRLLDAGGRAQDGLALLGRMALGSVIAADSLHDCFGAAADRWAAGVLSRLD